MGNIKAKLEAQGYTDGKLVERTRWVKFPIEAGDFVQEVIRLTEDKDGEPNLPSYAKRMVRITEWDYPDFLEDACKVFDGNEGEGPWAVDFEEVNKVCEQLKGIDEEEYEVVEALLDNDYELDEALRIVREGEYTDHRGDDTEDIVRSYTSENEIECHRIPDYIWDNLDYEAAFNDIRDNCCGKFIDTDSGWIYIDD